jgi:hypothetical protein
VLGALLRRVPLEVADDALPFGVELVVAHRAASASLGRYVVQSQDRLNDMPLNGWYFQEVLKQPDWTW